MTNISSKLITFLELSMAEKKLLPLVYYYLLKSVYLTKRKKHTDIIEFLKSKSIKNKYKADNKLLSIKSAVSIASKYSIKTKCYEQAIASSMTLIKYNIKHNFYIGTKKENELEFHAWVTDYSNQIIIAGGEDSFKHSIIQEIRL